MYINSKDIHGQFEANMLEDQKLDALALNNFVYVMTVFVLSF